MAATVDERIVAAKFDASDFEKGVNKTIKKLDELKQSLNFKEATKSVKELAEKTEVSTNSMSNSLEKLTDRFTTFAGMIKQKILSGLADEFANVFLRMEQSIKNFITGISTQQISAGLDKYQQMLTSVRVMVSNGVSEESAYKAMEDLRSYADQTSYSITQMTDALSKMVSAGLESKDGVDGLEIATKAVQGIANACANAGINAQDAGRAFYNLAQAYGKGKLEYTDYKSLELLNMTTSEFKKELMEAAAEVGTLEKVSEGVYKITEKVKAKGAKGKKVNEKNITDMLRYDFVTNDVMNTFFGKYYFSEKEMDKIYEEMGISKFTATEAQKAKALEKAIEQYGELAVKAYMAAREARSFTDVINTLKDAVSSGWAQTFEYLFGKLEAAKDFFTELTEGPFAECIYAIGEYRNRILGMWDGIDGEGGGKVFRDTILNITKALGNLFHTFLQILPGFDQVDSDSDEANEKFQSLGKSLFNVSQKIGMFAIKIRKASEDFNKFMNSPAFEKGPTRIELIRNILSNLVSIFGIAGRVISIALHAISRALWSLEPLFDTLLVIFNKVTESFVDLRNNEEVFKDLEYSVDNITKAIHKVLGPLEEIAGFIGEVAKFFLDISIGTFTESITFFSDLIGLFIELFGKHSAQMDAGESVLARVKKDFEGIKKACEDGLGAVKEFFGALLGDIKTLLGLNQEAGASDNKTGGVFAGLTNFFKTNQFVKDAKAWVNQAIIDVGDFIKSIPSRVKAFGANIYNTLYNLFFEEKRVKDVDENGKTTFKTTQVLTPLGEWLDGVIKDVKAFILDLPNKIIAGVGKVGNWIDDIFNSIFGDDSNKNENEAAKTAEEKAQEETNAKFQEFIDGIVASVKQWFADLPNKIQKGFQSVGSFISRLVNVIDEFLFGKKQTKIVRERDETGKYTGNRKVVTTRIKSGFSKWLDGVIVEVKKFIANIPSYIKAGIKGVGDLISTIINAIFGKKDDKEVTNKDVQEELEKPFLGIDISNIINSLKEIGLEIFNQIARIFTGSDKLEENQEWFSNAIANGIKWIRTKAEEAFKWVLNFISTLPQTIANIFSGENKDNQTQGPIGKALSEFGIAIGDFILNLPTALLEFINSAITEIGKLWDKLYNGIFNGSDNTWEESLKNNTKDLNITDDMYKQMQKEIGKQEQQKKTESAWEKFVRKLGETISNIWAQLPVWIANGIDLAIAGIGSIINTISDWISPEKIEEDIKKSTEQASSTAVEAAADSSTEGAKQEEPRLITAIKNIGLRIRELFVDIIPGFISNAWNTIFGLGSEIWTGLSAVFTGQEIGDDHPLAKGVKDFGDKIKNRLTTDIPGAIKSALDFINNLFGSNGAVPEIVKPGTKKKNVAEQVVDQYTDTGTGDSGIVSRLKELGNHLREMFATHVAPVLSNVWDWLKENGKITWEGIKNIFNGTPTSDFQQGVITFGQKIWKFITTDIPKYISQAFDFVSNWISGDSWKNTLESVRKQNGLSDDVYNQMYNAIEGQQKQVDDKLKGKSKDNSIWSGLGSFFESIGPALLNGLAVVLDTIGNVVMMIVNALTGDDPIEDQVERAYGKEKPELRNALKKIGESIRKILLETIPSFIGSAFGTLTADIPEFFSKFFESFQKAETEEKKKIAEKNKNNDSVDEDPEEAARSTIAGLKQFLKEISLTFVGLDINAIGIIIAVAFLLRQIRNLFSLADELDNAGYALKWAAILVAVTALSGIIATILDMCNSGNDHAVEQAKGFLKDVTSMLETVAWIVGLFTVGKIADAVGEFGSAKAAKASAGVTTKLTKGEKLLEGLTGGVANFFTVLGGTAGAAAGTGLAQVAVENIFNSITDSFLTLSSGVADALTIITPFVKDLSALKDEINNALDAATSLATLFSVFWDVFELMYRQFIDPEDKNEGANYSAVRRMTPDQQNNYMLKNDSKKQFLEILQDRMELFLELSVFVNELMNALKNYSDIENAAARLSDMTSLVSTGKFTELLTALMNSLSDAMENSKLNPAEWGVVPDLMARNNSGISVALSMLGDSLSIFTNGIAGLTSENVDAFSGVLKVFEELAVVLSEADNVTQGSFQKLIYGDKTLAGIGYQFKIFGMYMEQFYNYITKIPGFDTDELREKTVAQVESVLSVANGMATASEHALLGDADNFGKFGEKLPGIATHIGDFLEKIDRSFKENKLTIDNDKIRALAEIINSVGVLMEAAWHYSDGTTLTDIADNLWKGLSGSEGEKFVGAISGIATKIGGIIKDPETLLPIKDAGRTLAAELYAGIQAAFDEDPNLTIKVKIEPVINSGQYPFNGTFGAYTPGTGINPEELASIARGANNQTESGTITARLSETDLTAITNAIHAGPDGAATAGDLTAAFSQMRIWLDKELLVGGITDAIDEALGRRIFLLNYQTTR